MPVSSNERRRVLSSTARLEIAVAASISVNSGAVQTITLSPNHVVEANKGYYIRVLWDGQAAVNTIAFWGATVTYTLP